jgi:hypothetical protein
VVVAAARQLFCFAELFAMAFLWFVLFVRLAFRKRSTGKPPRMYFKKQGADWQSPSNI